MVKLFHRVKVEDPVRRHSDWGPFYGTSECGDQLIFSCLSIEVMIEDNVAHNVDE